MNYRSFFLTLFSFFVFIAADANPLFPNPGLPGSPQPGSERNLRYVFGIQNLDAGKNSDSFLYDQDILSPKSVKFHPTQNKVYVNSLEGFRTVVYRWSEQNPRPQKLKTIGHRFNNKNQHLFMKDHAPASMIVPTNREENKVNIFNGKPVEMVFSHGGRYLWVTYYRRSYDQWAQFASGVAIIDTKTDEIIRVIKTGPIAKVVAYSQELGHMAIVNWGNNTVGLIDVNATSPAHWSYSKLLYKNKPLSQKNLEGSNRDSSCGLCLRGALFLPGTDTLIVGAMRGGAVLGFNTKTGQYLGQFWGLPATVRHIVYSERSDEVLFTSNQTGYLSSISLNKVIRFFANSNGQDGNLAPDQKLFVGPGARTVTISPNGREAFLAISNSSEIVGVDLEQFRIFTRVSTNSYPVGLDISPGGNYVWSTSQGKSGRGGGNAVNIFQVYNLEPQRMVLR